MIDSEALLAKLPLTGSLGAGSHPASIVSAVKDLDAKQHPVAARAAAIAVDASTSIYKVFGVLENNVAALQQCAPLPDHKIDVQLWNQGCSEFSKSTGPAIERGIAAAIRADVELEKHQTSLDQTILAKCTAAIPADLAREIRAHYKSLPEATAKGMLNAAVSQGDTVDLTALRGGPAYLSGLDVETIQFCGERLASVVAADEVKQVAAVKALRASIESSRTSLSACFSEASKKAKPIVGTRPFTTGL